MKRERRMEMLRTFVATLIAGTISMTQAHAFEPKTERQKNLVNFYEVLRGNPEKADKILIEDWVSHDPNPGQEPGRDGFKKFAGGLSAVIKDFEWTIEEMVEDGNSIAVRSTFAGKHTIPLFGEPTGKAFEIKAIDIHHFNAEGMVTETYHLEDWATMMGQVGLLGKH